ncbi:MAG: GntR family transcriptional regulator [Actinomycetota bacterium]
MDIEQTLRSFSASQRGGLVRSTISEQVREVLRHAILSGQLPGGTRLGLAEIADILDVSTTPVREALRVLASDGFVQLDPYRGAIVRSPDKAEAEELVRLRQALEPLAMEEAMQALRQETIDDARRLLRVMLERPDSDEWVEANKEFHEVLYRGVSSQRLLEILGTLRTPIVMYVSRAVTEHATFREVANQQHVALMEAVEAGDVARAKEIIIDHVALPLMVTSSDDDRDD